MKIYVITPNHDDIGIINLIPKFEGMILLTEDELEATNIRFLQHDKVCILSETSLELAKNRLEDSRQTNAVNVLKDKYAFRKCLKTIYPNYFFEQVNIRNISTLHVKKKCVIKPQKGFFGTAVLEIDEQSNMKSIQKELEREMIKHAKLYPDDI